MKVNAKWAPKSVDTVRRGSVRLLGRVHVTLQPRIPDPVAESETDQRSFVPTETSLETPIAVERQEIALPPSIGDAVASESRFGPNETTCASPALLRAIEDCADFNGQRFFQNRRENRLAMLVLAYLLLLELVAGGEEAITLAINRFPPETRERRPSPNKTELIAVQLTAKPDNEPQRKLCSDYSSLLMVARVKGLSPTDFISWIEEADIGDCKIKAKRIRAALKAGLPPEIEDEPVPTLPASSDEPWVQISHGRGQQVGGSYSASIPEIRLSPVADLIEAGVESGGLPSVLRMIATALEAADSRDLAGAAKSAKSFNQTGGGRGRSSRQP